MPPKTSSISTVFVGPLPLPRGMSPSSLKGGGEGDGFGSGEEGGGVEVGVPWAEPTGDGDEAALKARRSGER